MVLDVKTLKKIQDINGDPALSDQERKEALAELGKTPKPNKNIEKPKKDK